MTGLLRSINESLKEARFEMHYVIFTTFEARRDGKIISGKNHTLALIKRLRSELTAILADFYDVNRATVSEDDQNACAQIWKVFDSSAKVLLEPTIEDALDRARGLAEPGVRVQTFITGTDRLIGPALTLLTQKPL